ncbi:MAG: hypothetical protein IKW60_01095 [Clostridia bacterium]|nr:hypothetical protein [Clostridia bacterium]
MILKTKEEVKAWFRGLDLMKKDLEMKSAFYGELVWMSRNLGESGKKHEAYYLEKIQELHRRIQLLAEDIERVMNTLWPEERAVLTARYIRDKFWDAMEFQVHYSKRHSIRIHDRAVEKLIGQEVDCDVYRGKA